LSITSVGTAGYLRHLHRSGTHAAYYFHRAPILNSGLRSGSQRAAFSRCFRKDPPSGFAIIELDGSKIIAVNPAYRKMLGCTAREMQTVGIFDELTFPADRESDKEQIFLE
jgi:PAS domain-containing protein